MEKIKHGLIYKNDLIYKDVAPTNICIVFMDFLKKN